MRNKGFNQFSACFSKDRCATEVRRVRFDLRRIEVVLADQEAQPVSQLGLPVIRAIRVEWFCGLSLFLCGTGRTSKPSQLFDRAESNSISLAESAINRASLGHAHFCATNEEGCV